LRERTAVTDDAAYEFSPCAAAAATCDGSSKLTKSSTDDVDPSRIARGRFFGATSERASARAASSCGLPSG
jgi:hypothetical protein